MATRSNAKAKYKAMAYIAYKMVWLQSFMEVLGFAYKELMAKNISKQLNILLAIKYFMK